MEIVSYTIVFLAGCVSVLAIWLLVATTERKPKKSKWHVSVDKKEIDRLLMFDSLDEMERKISS